MSEDTFKGWWHQAMALSFGVMAAYNAMRFCSTRQKRNAINVAIYVPLAIYEMRQAQHHWSKP